MENQVGYVEGYLGESVNWKERACLKGISGWKKKA